MIPKQDRQGVRKPSDIEQKYTLDQDYNEVMKVVSNANRAASNAQSVANNSATVAMNANATANNAATVANEAKEAANKTAVEVVPFMESATKNTATIAELLARLEALDGKTTISVVVTDYAEEADTLLNSVGTLTVAGRNIEQVNAAVTVSVGNVTISYTLNSDIDKPRTVSVNGASVGAVSVSGDIATATFAVTSGSEITISFTEA